MSLRSGIHSRHTQQADDHPFTWSACLLHCDNIITLMHTLPLHKCTSGAEAK
jgi:hypothetical protein